MTYTRANSVAKTSKGPVMTSENWPKMIDYRTELKHPQICFEDRWLKESVVECKREVIQGKERFTPKARTGALASVFRLDHADGTATALRVFHTKPPKEENIKRLHAISQHLNGLGAKRPSFLLKFNYEPEGILCNGAWRPIQTMEWVDGKPLGTWYEDQMRAKNYGVIRQMADHWQKLVYGLQDLKIAHGDLQHGNVVVRQDNTPVLVDYDGMCVPKLVESPLLPCMEFGLPGYVHPKRNEAPLNLDLDHFPAWIILIALRATVADPRLFKIFHEERRIESLLFTQDDIHKPGSSKLWPALFKSPDPEVAGWAVDLRACLDRPFAEIPPFQSDPTVKLVELCKAAVADWEAIDAEANRLTQLRKSLPSNHAVQAKVADARKRITAREKLRAALLAAETSTDPRPVAALFDPAVFRDWPGQQKLVQAATEACVRAELLTELEAAARNPTDGRRFVEVWDRHRNSLARCAPAQMHGQQAEVWRKRILAAKEYSEALAVQPVAEKRIATAWTQVLNAGPPHPSISQNQKSRGETAIARSAALDELRPIPPESKALSEATDRKLVDLWNKHQALLNGCAEASGYPTRAAAAALRLGILKTVESAVQRGARDSEIVAAAEPLPPQYEYDLRERVSKAREGEFHFAGLRKLLEQPGASDLTLAEEWMKVKTAHPRQAALLDQSRLDRCKLALIRTKIIKEFESAIREVKAPYELDKRLFAIWQAGKAKIAECVDLNRFKRRILLAIARLKALETLKSAVRTQNLSAIRGAFAAPGIPGFAEYHPVVEIRPQIDKLIRLADWLDELRRKLETCGQNSGFPLTSADLENLRQAGPQLEPATRDEVLRLIRERLWPAVRLAANPGPPTVSSGPNPTAKVRWTWTGMNLISWFEVATSASPLSDPSQAARDRIGKCRPEDHARNGGGRDVSLRTGASQYVNIWPVLDLRWAIVHGPPIHIGPIRTRG